MKAKFVLENLKEQDEPTIEDIEFSDDSEFQDEFEVAIRNELEVPEFSRRIVSFKLKGSDETIDAIPMARLKDGKFLMKIGNKYQKFDLNDIIEESFKKGTQKLYEGK